MISHVFPNVEESSPIHCIHFKPTKRELHKSIKGLQVQQVAFDCILFGKSSLTNSYTWWNEYNLMPKLYKFRPVCVPFKIATTYVPSLNIVLFSHSCQSVSVKPKISPSHMSLSSSVYWNFHNIHLSHNLVFVIRSLSSFGLRIYEG